MTTQNIEYNQIKCEKNMINQSNDTLNLRTSQTRNGMEIHSITHSEEYCEYEKVPLKVHYSIKIDLKMQHQNKSKSYIPNQSKT